jgi:hypothetical protein
MDLQTARRQIWDLRETLTALTGRDPDQEVLGIAVPVVQAILESCGTFLSEDPVVTRIDGLLEMLALEDGSLRAADALIVVNAVSVALGKPRNASISVPRGTIPGVRQRRPGL